MKQGKHVQTTVFLTPAGRDAARLGELGFSTKFIAAETGLTPCQVTYRLHQAGIKRNLFRNGESSAAKEVMLLPATRKLQQKLDALCREVDKDLSRLRKNKRKEK